MALHQETRKVRILMIVVDPLVGVSSRAKSFLPSRQPLPQHTRQCDRQSPTTEIPNQSSPLRGLSRGTRRSIPHGKVGLTRQQTRTSRRWRQGARVLRRGNRKPSPRNTMRDQRVLLVPLQRPRLDWRCLLHLLLFGQELQHRENAAVVVFSCNPSSRLLFT